MSNPGKIDWFDGFCEINCIYTSNQVKTHIYFKTCVVFTPLTYVSQCFSEKNGKRTFTIKESVLRKICRCWYETQAVQNSEMACIQQCRHNFNASMSENICWTPLLSWSILEVVCASWFAHSRTRFCWKNGFLMRTILAKICFDASLKPITVLHHTCCRKVGLTIVYFSSI